MQPDLSKTKLRAYQYTYIDGTFEFIFGGFCLLLAGFFYIQAAMPESLLSTILTMSLVIITPAGALLINRLVNRFKENVTYPRTGYVAFQRPKEGLHRGVRVGFMLGLTAIIGGTVAAFITRTPQTLDWMPLLTGFVFGGVFFWIGFRSALPRFVVIALLILLCGLVLTLRGIGDMPGLSLFYALSGLILLLSGAFTLWRYLRRNPPTSGVTDES
jgi:hypothetical protein